MEDQVQKPSNPSQQPVPSVSSVNKETGPSNSSYVLASESEPKLNEDVKSAGVETVSQDLNLTKEHTDVGIKPSFPKPEVKLTENVQLPTDKLTEEQAREIVKQGEGSELDVGKHFDGIYHAPSILGLAVLKLKELSRKLLRQTT